MRLGRKTLSTIAVLALLVGIGVGNWLPGYLGHGGEAPTIQGAIYSQPRAIPAFELIDQNGVAFTNENFSGVWTLVYFGYSHCPDICPTTLASLGSVQSALAESGKDEDTAYVFISVDPARDTPERLATYAPHFSERMLGVTGEQQQLKTLSQALGVVYLKVGDDPEDYLMDHSSVVLAINPAGQLQAVLTAPHTAEQLLRDFTRVRDHYRG